MNKAEQLLVLFALSFCAAVGYGLGGPTGAAAGFIIGAIIFGSAAGS